MPEVRGNGPNMIISVLSLFNCKKNCVHPAFVLKIRQRSGVIFNRKIKLSIIGVKMIR